MGAVDFLKDLENRVVDAATYKLLERNFQMQDENNRLLQEKSELLLNENVRLKSENQSLREKLQVVRDELARYVEAAQYETRDGMAFRRKTDGLYEETPYCPNCRGVMGRLQRKIYQCAKCKHITEVKMAPELVARQLNQAIENKGVDL